MSERTVMSASQVTDEVLYKGLIEMQEYQNYKNAGGWGGATSQTPSK